MSMRELLAGSGTDSQAADLLLLMQLNEKSAASFMLTQQGVTFVDRVVSTEWMASAIATVPLSNIILSETKSVGKYLETLCRIDSGAGSNDVRTLETMAAVAASQTALAYLTTSVLVMNVVAASPAAMKALAGSRVAIAAIIASPIARRAVVSSTVAMQEFADSSTFIESIIASKTALKEVAESSNAMGAVTASASAMAAILKSSAARTAICKIGAPNENLQKYADQIFKTLSNNATKFTNLMNYHLQSASGDFGNSGKWGDSNPGDIIVFVAFAGVSSTNENGSTSWSHLQDTSYLLGAQNRRVWYAQNAINAICVGGVRFGALNNNSAANFYAWRAI